MWRLRTYLLITCVYWFAGPTLAIQHVSGEIACGRPALEPSCRLTEASAWIGLAALLALYAAISLVFLLLPTWRRSSAASTARAAPPHRPGKEETGQKLAFALFFCSAVAGMLWLPYVLMLLITHAEGAFGFAAKMGSLCIGVGICGCALMRLTFRHLQEKVRHE